MSVEHGFRQVPQFDGDPSKFQVFWVRFQGHATAMGCEDAIETTPNVNLPATKNATRSAGNAGKL